MILEAPHILQLTNQALRLRFVVAWTDAILGLVRFNKRQRGRAERLARAYPNPIVKARVYEAALAGGGSYAEAARHFGVTREEVCQYVALVRRLPAEFVGEVEAERDPAVLRVLSMRRLLSIAREPDGRARSEALQRLRDQAIRRGVRPSNPRA